MTLREFKKLSPGDAVFWNDPETKRKHKLVLKTFVIGDGTVVRVDGRNAEGKVCSITCELEQLTAA